MKNEKRTRVSYTRCHIISEQNLDYYRYCVVCILFLCRTNPLSLYIIFAVDIVHNRTLQLVKVCTSLFNCSYVLIIIIYDLG